MTWFVDASAIVALSVGEHDWEYLADLMDEEPERRWSPLARWESVVATARRLRSDVREAAIVVDHTARVNRLAMVSIGEAEASIALDAFERYSKGSGHPAQLNMGDCFAYACAKTNDARLLYKGNDFSHTDVALP